MYNVPKAHLCCSDYSLRMKTKPKIMTERESSDEDDEENLTEDERGKYKWSIDPVGHFL